MLLLTSPTFDNKIEDSILSHFYQFGQKVTLTSQYFFFLIYLLSYKTHFHWLIVSNNCDIKTIAEAKLA